MSVDKIKYFGNWEIEKEIGSGAFGTVYKIFKEEFGKKYYSAMKVIRIPQDKTEKTRLISEGMDEDSISTYYYQFVQDFVKEIELMASLQGNTNIVGYNDHLIEENEDGIGYTIYIRMEYLTPLDQYLVSEDNKFRILSHNEIVNLGIDICKALEVCSKKQIIHRDIKPDNIFVSENGDYKLGDFGIARQLEHTQSNLSKKGTYTYMAPEIYNGQPYNSTVDIYSLGIVLYRLLNKNRTPFLPFAPNPIKYTDKENALISRMSGKPIPSIPNVDDELNRIVLKACAFNPKERYQSITEMKMDLIATGNDPTIRATLFDNKASSVVENDKTESPFDKSVEYSNQDQNADEQVCKDNDPTVGPVFDTNKEESIDLSKEDTKHAYDSDNTVGPEFSKKYTVEEKAPSRTNKKKAIMIIIAVILLLFGIVIAVYFGANKSSDIDENLYGNTYDSLSAQADTVSQITHEENSTEGTTKKHNTKKHNKKKNSTTTTTRDIDEDSSEETYDSSDVQDDTLPQVIYEEDTTEETTTKKQTTTKKRTTTKKHTTKKHTTKKSNEADFDVDDGEWIN